VGLTEHSTESGIKQWGRRKGKKNQGTEKEGKKCSLKEDEKRRHHERIENK